MGKRIRKIKNVRLHREGTTTLWLSCVVYCLIFLASYFLLAPLSWVAFGIVIGFFSIILGILINFFRCPLRIFEGATEGTIVAPADGRVVVIEEVEEQEYFHDRRIMVSIFMSVTNVHANWIPCEGTIKQVVHHNGNFMKAWLPKASVENERSTVVIETPEGQEILVRQVAGAVARRIVTYSRPGEDCFIDQHMGFIKFGSRVDTYLPLGTDVMVTFGQATVGNQTIIAKL